MTINKKPPAVVHVDLDGMPEICQTHGWDRGKDDPIFESGMKNLLEILDRNDIKATLFVIGQAVLDPAKKPWLVEAVARGHELASHTMTHPNLLHVDAQTRRREFEESRDVIGGELGVPIHGFRAPGYQVDRAAVELLEELGYQYDSSAFPTKKFADRLETSAEHLREPGAPYSGLQLLEIPLPDHRPSPVPFNPSYSHLLGMPYFRWGIRRQAKRQKPTNLLFHLIDMADPLPADRLPSWSARIFTLSHLTADKKIRKCQKMIDVVSSQFRILTTADLVRSIST